MEPREMEARNLLRAVLLFHSGGIWDEEKAASWKLFTGSEEATTKNMCDAIRSHIAEDS